MNRILKTLLEITIYSSVMIAAVIVMKAIWGGKISSKILSFLWFLVLIRLLLPITFDAPVHIDSFFPEKPVEETSDTAESPVENVIYTPENVIEGGVYYQPDMDVLDLSNETVSPIEFHTPSIFEQAAKYLKGISIWVYISVAWAMGAMLFLLKTIKEYIGFKRRVMGGENTERKRLNCLLAECKESLSLKKDISVMLCRYVSTPVTFGFKSPVILLPTRFISQISKPKLKMIVMHELCHIKSYDILKNCLWLFAKTIHWFNPLVWIAYRYYLEDVELACDEMVLKNIGEHERFEYSQSLIDVIKLSQKKAKASVAMAFCEDKSKIRKRVENMIEPKKKLKLAGFISMIMAVILIVGCFTTACLPTPEEATTQNEAEENSEEVTSATANPKTKLPSNKHITDTEFNSEGGTAISITADFDRITRLYSEGEITINIDGWVIKSDLETLPAAYVEKDYFSQAQVDKIMDVLFGDATLYDSKIRTKASIENSIRHIEQSALDLNSDLAQSNGIDNLEELRKLADERIADYQKRWQSAPVAIPVIEKFDISQNYWLSATADLGKDDMAKLYYLSHPRESDEIEFYNFGKPYGNRTRYIEPRSSEVLDLETYSNNEFDRAKEAVEQMLEDMKIEGFRLDTAYKSLDQTGGGDDEQAIWGVDSEREFYVFRFKRDTGSMMIDSYFYDGLNADGAYDYYDPQYDNPLKSEHLDIWIEGSEIVQFLWRSPVKTTGMANDSNEAIMDVDDAIDTMAQHAFIKYADRFQGLADNVIINIDKIELSLARIKEKDTGNNIIVPTWNFYGEVKLDISEAAAESIGLTLQNFPKDGDLYIISKKLRSIVSVVASD